MNIKKKWMLFFSVSILSITIISCSKTENPATTYVPLTKYTLSGTYKVTGLTFKPNSSDVEYDVYNIDTIFKACQKDDLLSFDTNYVYNYADSGVHCSAPSNYSGVYTITAPNLLAFDGENFIVQSISVNQVIMYQTQTIAIPLLGVLTGRLKTILTKQP